ncbi:hypothetical protein [Pseudoalteromonas sp. 1_2015MBL_MicDiv]|uniref:hypothetical protein n=1 Tax=Pseudoalteromonas sp. 1_2015MBL_MicDiv TaxID=1720343 RepID=UPI0018E0ABE0|nr:hypothetical protein [Pseudoalteromonas sp. 1_2015MBL_MicDiv]
MKEQASDFSKVQSVFTYSIFRISLIIPILLSIVLLLFIWVNDNLSITWPSKESLDVFLNYMEVPLWVLGSSIPLGTLAAANFRALQFQQNLLYQKENIERQNFEHIIDLYHKELSLFKEKFESIIINGKFKTIKGSNGALIFTRFYEKPTKENLNVINLNKLRMESVFHFMTTFEKSLFELGSKTASLEKENEFRAAFIETFGKNISSSEKKILFSKINIYDGKILFLLTGIEEYHFEICQTLGIKHFSISSENIITVIYSIFDIYGLQSSLFDDGNSLSPMCFSSLRQGMLFDILEHWVSHSNIGKSHIKNEEYKLNDFLHHYQITILTTADKTKKP